jgi:hypothetical protein
MTAIKKTIEVPATTRQEVNYQCDICGSIADGDEWEKSSDGIVSKYTEVGIRIEQKEHYQDNSSSEGEEFDCCPKCFRDKVRQALLALGLKPRETECHW